MIQWPLSVFLVALLALQEIFGAGWSIGQTFRYLGQLSVKSKTPSRAQSALLFALLASLSFSLWESLLRVMLQAEVGWPLSLLGAALLFGVLSWRHVQRRRLGEAAGAMSARQYALIIGGFALFIHAWISALVMSAWVYWRAQKVEPLARTKLTP